jgi:hypothetical protein
MPVRISVFGPYWPRRNLDRLIDLRDGLVEAGFADTELVRDRPDPPGPQPTAEEKSFYYLDRSDFNIMFFPRYGDKSGVSIEVRHVLELGPEIKRNTLLIVEIRLGEHDPLAVLTSLLRDAPEFSKLRVAKVVQRDDKLLLSTARSFVERRLIEDRRYLELTGH